MWLYAVWNPEEINMLKHKQVFNTTFKNSVQFLAQGPSLSISSLPPHFNSYSICFGGGKSARGHRFGHVTAMATS